MLVTWLRSAGSKMGPIFLRILMITAVSIYAVFGALVLSHLETYQIDQFSNFISQNDVIQTSSQSTLFSSVSINHWNQSQNNIRQCITGVIKSLLKKSNCSNSTFDHSSLQYFKYCYYYNLFSFSNMTENEQRNGSNNYLPTSFQPTNLHDMEMMNNSSVEAWPFVDSLLFAFALITTIGYGNITPKTFGGQMFCIFFAAFGVPLTLLTIADLGKFISQVIFACNDRINAQIKQFWRRNFLRNRFKMIISNHRYNQFKNNNSKNKLLHEENDNNETNRLNNNDKQINGTNESMEMNDNNEQLNRTLALIVLFIIYVIAGSLLLSSYEPEMPFFTAIYFNFITLTSIGLGDIVPQRRTYMGITILYIIVGLALTTIAIEIAADTLTKLHYFRRTIKNVGDIHIWFGGKRLTVRQLIRNLCDQFNVPDTALSGFNINNFVEQAIKVEAGERLPLRNATSRQEINAGEKNEVSTVVSKPSWTESEIKSEHEPESDHVSEITPISAQELEPEPTPEYESEPEAEEILSCEPTPPHSNSTVTEPTPIIVELEPIPDPESYLLKVSQEMEKIPYLPEIPEPEPMPLIESVPETSEISEATEESDLEQETSAEPENDIAMEKLKDDGVVRRKGYSEEAWKRYQEYQNEWSKFRRLSHTLSRNGHQKRIRKPRIAKLPDFSH